VLSALDEAADRRLLVRQADGFVFVHEQIREVLYQTLSAIRRRQLHQLTAEAIERVASRDPRAASRLAYHYSRGDDLERALNYSIVAARESTRVHALAEAIRLYNNALDILDGFDRKDTARRVFDILLELDTVLAAADERPPRMRGIERLLALSEHLGLLERVAALTRASANAREAGLQAESVTLARRAVASAAHLPLAAQVEACLALGQALTGRPIGEPSPLFRDRDRIAEAHQVFQRAWECAAENGDVQRQATIAQEIGVLEWALVENDEEDASRARSWLLRALDGFRAAGDRKGEVTALIALAYRRTIAPSATTDLRESYVSFLEEIRRLRATEHRLSRVSERPRTEALALLSIDLYSRTNGWYEVALRRAQQALVLADEARDARLAVMARIGLSETERLLGRYPQAIEHAERALAAIDSSPSTQASVAHQRDAAIQALAAAYALAGDSERALIEAHQRVARAADGPAAGLAEALTCLAEIAILASDAPLAAVTARRAIHETAGLSGGITWDVRAELVLARIALVADDAHLALGHAMAASGKLAERDLPHIQLQIAGDLVRGQALLATGFDDDAREALAAAREGVLRIAERITDQPLRSTFLSRSSLAVEVLAAASSAGLDGPSDDDATPGEAAPDLLTRREVEVLQQVASGLPNREIAERLYISEKTVARHLTNIFTKLDVESRTQAAAWAFRQGIA
jgi:DNA-binding CsgD family transcriptional regulator/tetratricopeptide (TPR) repeat protein